MADKQQFVDIKGLQILKQYIDKQNSETLETVTGMIGEIPTLEFEVVESLPESNQSTKKIYLVAKEDDEDDKNIYDEYLYVDDEWELIGNTAIDLEGYATTEDLSEAIQQAASNYATSEQGAKADTAVQDVAQGESDGTISVDGEDVEVKGFSELKTAIEGIEAISEDEIKSLFEMED